MQATETHSNAAEKINLALVMMQKDEGRLLDAWLRFHERLTDPARIHVLDNGSTDLLTREILEAAEGRGVVVERRFATNSDYQIKNEIFVTRVSELQAAGNDFIIPLDCDEFLFCFDEDGKADFSPEGFRARLAPHVGTEGHFLMVGSYYNSIGSGQRFGFGKERSVFFGTSPVETMDHGYHKARTVPQESVEVEIYQLHFQSKRAEISKRQATEKLRKRIPDFSRETLTAYAGAGSHMKKWFLSPPDGDGGRTTFPAFVDTVSEAGGRFPLELFFASDRYGELRETLKDNEAFNEAVDGGMTANEALFVASKGHADKRTLMYAPTPLAKVLADLGEGRVDVLSLSDAALRKRLPDTAVADVENLEIAQFSLGVSVDGFGNPSAPAPRSAVRRYALDYLSEIAETSEIGMAVINGRYRVACAASVAIVSPGTVILVPNFWSRPHYHVMLKFCGCVDTEDDSVALRLDPDVSEETLRGVLDRHLGDPR